VHASDRATTNMESLGCKSGAGCRHHPGPLRSSTLTSMEPGVNGNGDTPRVFASRQKGYTNGYEPTGSGGVGRVHDKFSRSSDIFPSLSGLDLDLQPEAMGSSMHFAGMNPGPA